MAGCAAPSGAVEGVAQMIEASPEQTLLQDPEQVAQTSAWRWDQKPAVPLHHMPCHSRHNLERGMDALHQIR